jgi:hypothetical protein
MRDFDRAVPDLKLMRDVTRHVDEYGRDGDRRRQSSPTTRQRIGRRSLHTMKVGEQSFHWLAARLISTRARTASFELLSAVRAARDQADSS